MIRIITLRNQLDAQHTKVLMHKVICSICSTNDKTLFAINDSERGGLLYKREYFVVEKVFPRNVSLDECRRHDNLIVYPETIHLQECEHIEASGPDRT